MGDYDHNEQVRQRQQYNAGTKQRLIVDLQVMFHTNNHLVNMFKQAKDLLQNHSDDHKIAIHADKTPAGQHPGRFRLIFNVFFSKFLMLFSSSFLITDVVNVYSLFVISIMTIKPIKINFIEVIFVINF